MRTFQSLSALSADPETRYVEVAVYAGDILVSFPFGPTGQWPLNEGEARGILE